MQPPLFDDLHDKDPQRARCRLGQHAPLLAGVPYRVGPYTVNRDKVCPACGRLVEIESTRQDIREDARVRTV